MFDRTKQCNLSHKMMIRLNNFLYVFNLRQGTILIAVHQIALSSFILIILLVGISHVGEMLSMLHNDMEDDADRRGLYEMAYGDHISYHNGEVITTNNQRRFAKARHLASVRLNILFLTNSLSLTRGQQPPSINKKCNISVTVIFLYTSTMLTSIYLMCCISLLHGAVKYKREYVLPWIMAACIGVVLLIVAIIVGDGYPCVVNLFGGHNLYRKYNP
ncbi:hypothetical protein HF086_011240 [Spodoptera exigua]|uniref:Uncharacterized protein n=1 Tax=Spodoptera exigua TaxID=7107 RepID=A0A922MGU7_SPOEX|nr:hypothetical protein HF086_011240 [Spodoptera exigua]